MGDTTNGLCPGKKCPLCFKRCSSSARWPLAASSSRSDARTSTSDARSAISGGVVKPAKEPQISVSCRAALGVVPAKPRSRWWRKSWRSEKRTPLGAPRSSVPFCAANMAWGALLREAPKPRSCADTDLSNAIDASRVFTEPRPLNSPPPPTPTTSGPSTTRAGFRLRPGFAAIRSLGVTATRTKSSAVRHDSTSSIRAPTGQYGGCSGTEG